MVDSWALQHSRSSCRGKIDSNAHIASQMRNWFWIHCSFSEHIEDKRGTLSSVTGWKLFMIIILVIIGLTVVGVVGFIVFQKQQENSRKRFYWWMEMERPQNQKCFVHWIQQLIKYKWIKSAQISYNRTAVQPGICWPGIILLVTNIFSHIQNFEKNTKIHCQNSKNDDCIATVTTGWLLC